jgi:hypothetical protein
VDWQATQLFFHHNSNDYNNDHNDGCKYRAAGDGERPPIFKED